MTQNLLGMTDCLIMTTLCLVFAVPLQVFDTHLKMIGDCLKIYFSVVLQKLAKFQQNQTIYAFMKSDVTPSPIGAESIEKLCKI
jgi:hypothetical protein